MHSQTKYYFLLIWAASFQSAASFSLTISVYRNKHALVKETRFGIGRRTHSPLLFCLHVPLDSCCLTAWPSVLQLSCWWQSQASPVSLQGADRFHQSTEPKLLIWPRAKDTLMFCHTFLWIWTSGMDKFKHQRVIRESSVWRHQRESLDLRPVLLKGHIQERTDLWSFSFQTWKISRRIYYCCSTLWNVGISNVSTWRRDTDLALMQLMGQNHTEKDATGQFRSQWNFALLHCTT